MALADKYQVNNVWISAVTPDNISRQAVLAWVNDQAQSQLTKVEEMSTGAAYCQLTDRLFPGSVNLKKVKWNSRSEVDWINNWRILQKSWTDLGIDKPVNVQTLMKAKFQDNFEFLQWFKKFYDANNCGYDYNPLESRGGEQFPQGTGRPGARIPARPAAAPVRRVPAAAAPAAAKPIAARPSAAVKPSTTAKARPQTGAPAAPQVDPALQKELEDTKAQLVEYEKSIDELTNERDYYYERLRSIEELCNALGEDASLQVSQILAILYKKDGEEDHEEDLPADQQSNGTVTLDQNGSTDDVNVTQDVNTTVDRKDEEEEQKPAQEQSNGTLEHEESTNAVDVTQDANITNDSNGTNDLDAK